MRRIHFATLAIGLCATASAAPNWYYEYEGATITDLLTLPGDSWSIAYDINNNGKVVGDSGNGTKTRAFLYTSGMTTVPLGAYVANSHARGINDNNEFVGYLHWTLDPPYVDRGWYSALFLGMGLHLQSNPQAPLSYNWSMRAYAINNSGVIVGGGVMDFESSDDPIPDTQGDCYSELPVRWGSASAQAEMLFCPADLPNAVQTIAYDINNNGDTVGVDNGTTSLRMFLEKSGASVQSVPGPPGALSGTAFGLSNGGHVTGMFNSGSNYRAFYWNGTSATAFDLGIMAGGNISMGKEVNDQGFVAGYSTFQWNPPLGSGPVTRRAAFIWGPNIGMVTLPSLGTPYWTWNNCEANALNNRVDATGRIQVVGYCETGGEKRAVRWNVTVARKIGGVLQP
jgi:probable HAF family extracellular repeat protein